MVNLTPLLEKENKEIKNEYPSNYYKKFKSHNSKIDESLENMKIDSKFLQGINKNYTSSLLKRFWKEGNEVLKNYINEIDKIEY